jgi:cell division GTPase FtsZ
MKTMLIGIGAAGNKAVMTAVNNGTMNIEDTIMINSTSKDFPKEYDGTKIVLSQKDTGCGKERSVAKEYALQAINAGKLTLEVIDKYETIIISTSVEGGTGSGSTPIIAKFFNQCYKKNVHIVAFAGFEEDVRGLSNTIEFFKDLDPNLIFQTIRNKAFMTEAGGNKFIAEELANEELCKRINIITGKIFIPGSQNIDDTDISKLSNTSGYTVVEQVELAKPLLTTNDFAKVVKRMTVETKSIKSPGSAVRMGIILNISPESEDAIDYSFSGIKEVYGYTYECYTQKQWDGKKEYIALIASGLQMPLQEVQNIFERYKEQTSKVNKSGDEFFSTMKEMNTEEDDKKFDMIRGTEKGKSIQEFMSQFNG